MEEMESKILETIKENEGEEGTTTGVISEVLGIDEDKVTYSLQRLYRKDLIYEPIVGRFKYLG